jgi:Domain of unknown function (DUF1735)
MKRTIKFNKILSFGSLLIAMNMISVSCVKSRTGETTFNSLQPVVLIPEGGMQGFGASALTFPGTDSSDQTSFRINYAATNVAPADETVTIAIDPTALADYNATGGLQYQIFPDSIFSFPATQQITVKKGQNYSDAINLTVFPYKIDPTQNYMLPVTITAGPAGALISQNFGTIYFHAIGNPLAGTYSWDWKRFNAADTTGTPNGASFTGGSTSAQPDDANTIEFQSGYGNQNGFNVRYVVTFDHINGQFSNFQVALNASDVKGNLNGNLITVSAPASIIKIDTVAPGKYNFRFTYGVLNSVPAPRTFVDYYYH